MSEDFDPNTIEDEGLRQALTAIVSARFFVGKNAPARPDRSSFVRGGAPARTERSAFVEGDAPAPTEGSAFVTRLRIGAVDLYTGHYYPPSISAFNTQVHQAIKTSKVFIVGEYDWNTNKGASLSSFLLTVEQSGAVGDMYWSLFPHNDMHGFVQHNEHFTLHYPGDTPDMRSRVRLLCAHAYAMRGLPVPTIYPPGAPHITFIIGNALVWRGAAGADTYTVERSTVAAAGRWVVICNRCATDSETPGLIRQNLQAAYGIA